ncbi:MAG: Fic family protein [Turicibacter sp.]|nr:Fic family protein [Turicibacter sp.]
MDFDERPYVEEIRDDSVYERMDLWETSFGLQATDNLKPSAYMVSLAKAHVLGEKDYEEISNDLNTYYSNHEDGYETMEADFASLRINEILSTTGFTFSPATLLSYHRRLFSGITSFRYPVGEFRKVNITKSEEVLGGDSVIYTDFSDISDTLNWDFSQEKGFDYGGLSKEEMAHHVMDFISNAWQVHPFREGNTRTVAVFTIKYLRHLGFEINNTPFKQNAKYFRDALVIANAKRPLQTKRFLKKFTENILLDGKNALDKKEMIKPDNP